MAFEFVKAMWNQHSNQLESSQKDTFDLLDRVRHRVSWTDYAVANVFKDGTIELHKDLALEKYKNLRNQIIKHELDHDFKKGFIHNLGIDMVPRVNSFQIWKFMFTRPKTWIQVLPIYYQKDKGLVYDKNQIFFWSIIAIFIFILFRIIN